jgi:hypothetical protein
VILSQFEMQTSVGAVRVDHVLDGVGDDVARGQRVEHAVVAHRDAIVHGDRVELAGDAARLLDRLGDDATHGREVRVAGHELGERVRDGDDGLAADRHAVDAGCAHQRACAGHVASVGDSA